MSRFLMGVAGALAITVGSSSAVTAQTIATPAEFPPTSFTGRQYVDSTGCAFVRAGSGALVNWVPRVTRSREQLCGFQPTDLSTSSADASAAGPLVLFGDPLPGTESAAPVEAAAAAAAPAIVAVAQPVAATLAAPVPNPAPVAAPAPAPLPVGAAVAGAPVPVVQPAPAPRRITLAEACEGKSGIQAGYVLASGGPLNCGPAPAPAAAPIEILPPVPAPVAATGPRRVTRAAICAEIAATGKRVIDAATGAPVACSAAAVTLARTPVAASVAASAPRAVAAAMRSMRFSNPFTMRSVPASNPAPETVRNERIRPPAGYKKVWTDGRINPHRGLPNVTR